MNKTKTEKIYFIITPEGFQVDPSADYEQPETRKRVKEFKENPIRAFYEAGFKEQPDFLDAAGNYLYTFMTGFIRLLTETPDLDLQRENLKLRYSDDFLLQYLNGVPFVPGAEYVTREWIIRQFDNYLMLYCEDLSRYQGSAGMYLTEKSQKIRVPERVFFHLVENTKSKEHPFAFMATYATKDEKERVTHVPLRHALIEYKGEPEKLLPMLSCLDKAAHVSPFIDQITLSGEIFHPLQLTAAEAYQLLKDAETIESCGILFRLPNWWRKHSRRASLTLKMGNTKPSLLGLETMLSLVPEITIDGEKLTKSEIRELLSQTDGLAMLKGKWVVIDHDRLEALLEQMEAFPEEISLGDVLRGELPAASLDGQGAVPEVSNGVWLMNFLGELRSPERAKIVKTPASFKGTLRPYQEVGYSWLTRMDQYGFGCCLADDMGLGKTVQMLSYMEQMRKKKPDARVLLVVPASLLGNWEKEKERFAPKMPSRMLHGMKAAELADLQPEDLAFLNITTYGMLSRSDRLTELNWDCVIADEAQAIKNPLTKQTKQIKKLRSGMRIAMTGTPIENDLTNLWSLFDFLNKGLLGTSREFKEFTKNLEDSPDGYEKLRSMISPFMLRRSKTDKTIISDLPDKIELTDTIDLSKKQIVLYQKYLSDLENRLNEVTADIERRGVVLASLTKLKQICNHPDQYLGQEAYEPSESGKFEMLREICETIYAKRERVLVFTQYTEIIPYLDDYLASIFNCRGLVLQGKTAASKRTKLVEEFQGDAYVPYMVLSLKAAGVGLNLTNASHVIHFDRWWNPAVENQATDRAFRIGQKNNVIVHKFVCRGTIEEKIDELIQSKRTLAENIVGDHSEKWLTEMSNDELLSMLRLDLKA